MKSLPRRHVFRDRRDGGRALAKLLEHYRGLPDVLVVGLPRGGVPVAAEVAAALGAPLEVLIVRKLGAPGHEELAMGAIASNGAVVINDDVVQHLGVDPPVVEMVAQREREELARREAAYRSGRPPLDVGGRIVILVDDGVATGSSMRAAIAAVRQQAPGRLVVAVPTAPEPTADELSGEVDEVVCATTPTPFLAVGACYRDFTQTTDEEVRQALGPPS